MRTGTVLGLLAGLVFCCHVQAKTIGPEVNEYVELMSVLARLADYPEYCMDLGGGYTEDVDRYFGKYEDHEAVNFMRSLRSSNGVMYDAVMCMAVHLTEFGGKISLFSGTDPSKIDDRWQGVDMDEFLMLLNGFYRDTCFGDFFASHRPFYEEAIRIYKDSVMGLFHENWFSEFYGTEPSEEFSVIIGFCNGGANYGPSRHLAGKNKEVFSINGYMAGKPQFDKRRISTLVHEFNHSFVNHLLDDHQDNVWKLEGPGTALLRLSSASMFSMAYGEWQIVINESVVRAATICYMMDNGFLDDEVLEQLVYEVGCNFRWMPELVVLLRKYEKRQDRYGSLEKFYPQIIKFFENYTDKEIKRISAPM